jgi:hypothetical protein
MKTILIANPRTGSTSISFYVQELKGNRQVFIEPFYEHRDISYKEVLSYDNSFTKQIYNQLPKEYNNMKREDFYEMVFKDFDKVVFLDRRNITKQSESYSSALVRDEWYGKYMYDPSTASKHLEITQRILSEIKHEMQILSNIKNMTIHYYEDIYFNEEYMVNFLKEINCEFNEPLYKKYLDRSNTYRSGKIDKTII